MRYRELAVLDEDDRELIDVLGMAMARDVARVLAYLLQRTRMDSVDRTPATRLEIQVGTGLGRDATIRATNELTERSVLEATTVDHPQGGSDRKAWRPVEGTEATIQTVFATHAQRLRERGVAEASRFSDLTPESGGGNRAGDTDSLAVALNWDPNAVHFPLLAAREAGFYRDTGLAVDLHENPGSGAAVQSMIDGEAPLGVAGPITMLRAITEGQPIAPIAVLYQRSMVVLYTLAEDFPGSFHSIEQLSGHRLAMAADSELGRVARLVLSQQGLLEAVEVVSVSGEEREALQSGAADVAVGVFTDPIALREEGIDVEEVPIADGFPIPGPALVAHMDAIADRQSAIDAFLEATMRGWERGLREPRAVAADLESIAVGPTNPKIIEALIERFGTAAASRRHGWGWQDSDAWDRVAATLQVVEEAE